MERLKTNDDLIKELLTNTEQKELYSEIEQEVKRMRGGKRANAGRKKLDEDNVLKFQIRVSKREKAFIDYARSHHLNYEELMEG